MSSDCQEPCGELGRNGQELSEVEYTSMSSYIDSRRIYADALEALIVVGHHQSNYATFISPGAYSP